MRYELSKFKCLEEMAYIDVCRISEQEARTILEGIRWPEGPICPHCQSKEITRLNTEVARDGLLKCRSCRKQFTVLVGTVMKGSHITLRQWVQAFYSICTHKKGVSALQLQKNLGLGSYRSAWYLKIRIRKSLSKDLLAPQLKETVEDDETDKEGKSRKGCGKEYKRSLSASKTPAVEAIKGITSKHLSNKILLPG